MSKEWQFKDIKKVDGKRCQKGRWEITEVITKIRKAEVNADNYNQVHYMYKDQYHELDWYTDKEFVDDCDSMTGHIEEIE